MQLTEQEVGQSLRALRTRMGPGGPAGRRPGRRLYRVPDRVGEVIRCQPAIRPGVVDAAKARLADTGCPSDDDLARFVVGRLVCDRLR